MIVGIIGAIYFEISLRWLGGVNDPSLVSHLIRSLPQVFCLVIGAVIQWGAVRNKYGSEMMPAWFCRVLCLVPLLFVIGNIILFAWLFVFGGIDRI